MSRKSAANFPWKSVGFWCASDTRQRVGRLLHREVIVLIVLKIFSIGFSSIPSLAVFIST